MGARLALAFSAGMVATVNPCGFALLPAYLTYFLGLEQPGADGELEPGASVVRRSPVLRSLVVAAAVTAGFLVVFGIMGLAWSSISSAVGQRLPWFTLVIGIGLVVLGIAVIRGFEPTVRLPHVDVDRSGRELVTMFLYGISYAVASLSCTIPVFISLVSVTLDGSFGQSLAAFVAYGLGMGMTLGILTMAVALARTGIVTTFRRILPHMQTISGVLLVLAGLFVGYYAWVEIQELGSGSSSPVVDAARDVQSWLQNRVEEIGGGRLAAAAAVIIVAAVAVALVRRTGAADNVASEPE
ncbi:cytochrome c biogenesis CcdA family protein [Dermatobacter hominis]|uniref:cytochrome c biogenesis CcdA family protein n=1 Tax=Dermatobacter hominis TaxID=2884263 RepID=UPI001D109894|nr:cytochrome c biogenesis CcdA family protein [Dermatobacter hominis]UDY34059.1 cytochrome c biogenesis CcdA family protein [Dermatobacter hominis]